MATRGETYGLGVGSNVVLLQEISSFFFGLTTDFTDHNNTLGLRVLQESGQTVDEVGTVERVTTNTDTSRLTEVDGGRLSDSFICQSTRS
jgi:hypothetical protein